ncbi:MAG: DNA ligase D, partial [Gammaproteobacteria bacterium]
YDGYRLVIVHENDTAMLYSRAGNDLTGTFPEIADSVARLPFAHLIMDGEAVVHDVQGIPSFSLLQKRGRLMRKAEIQRATVDLPASLYVFDLLGFDDYDLRPLPLETRKTILRELIPSVGPVRFSDHIEEHGETMYAHASELGLEGMVAKKADSPYRAGRSAQWRKITIERRDDFVVIGYTDPQGSQTGFGALLLGQYLDGELVYAGRAGSGFKQGELRELGKFVEQAKDAGPPRDAPAEKDTHWIEPVLVCEVKFKETTPDGVLRQPVFVRLRDDKKPQECVREPGEHELPEPDIVEAEPEPVDRQVSFTNLDKVFWPEDDYTKGDLIEYHRSVAQWLLPYLKDRPVVLTRYPDGIDGKSFFQKDAPAFAPDWMRIERMWSEHAEREVGYFVADNLESLLYIINMGTIPLHIWSSRIASLERPDWCILDLDPKGAPFKHVVKIARAIHELCDDIELPCFAKTSGSTGLHVLVPLGREYTYEQSRNLGELLARVVVAQMPDIATVTRAVSRRDGCVYVDYLQNGHGRLLVTAFSARPLPAAPVSMPLKWSEVNARLDNRKYTIKNAARRMQSLKKDPLSPVLELKPDLGAALERLATKFG